MITQPEYGTLNPAKEKTFEIVNNLITEILESFQPRGKNSNSIVMHLGGDEVLSSMWSGEDIKRFMKEKNFTSLPQLENYYFNKVRSMIDDQNTYIYWVNPDSEQIYDVYNKDKTVLMYWGFNDKLKSFLDRFDQNIKRNIIIASGEYLYLDCGSGNKYGNPTWCGDYKTWKTIYNFPIFENYKNFTVLGSQVVLFGELADENSILGKIFPRASSLAEILWSGKERNIKDFFIRLIYQNKRMIRREIKTIAFTTQLCEENPEECLSNIK
jgi:hexosaminidase